MEKEYITDIFVCKTKEICALYSIQNLEEKGDGV